MLRKTPLVVILGSTGTGKTKLSIDIARRFNGEIISADSMQVYRGLDIVTAKADAAERRAAKHHLLDVAQPGESFTVVHYRDRALGIIEDLLAKNKMPIIVGGTNYYIESLLWKVLVEPTNSEFLSPPRSPSPTQKRPLDEEGPSSSTPSKVSRLSDEVDEDQCNEQSGDSAVGLKASDSGGSGCEAEWDNLESSALHEMLAKVDPVMAGRLHPNNKRKILRSLQVLQRTGRPLSDILTEQRTAPGGCLLGGPLRFPHVVLLWLRCEQTILDERLDARVDSMINQGLIQELRDFHKLYVRSSNNADYTRGILQTIGLKEFIPYLNNEKEEAAKNNDESLMKNKEESLLIECLNNLKLVTRRYARKQNRWVLNRFLGTKDRQVPPLYSLDTSYPKLWDDIVSKPAINIIKGYIENVETNIKALPQRQTPNSAPGMNPEITHFCDVCNRVFIGDFQFEIHRKSRKHQKMVKRSKAVIPVNSMSNLKE